MFGKKKQTTFSGVDYSLSVANDFRLRSSVIGYESYRPADYLNYHKLLEAEMLPLLDEHLSKLLSGEVDDGNGDMLDSILFGRAYEALSDLEEQHYSHINVIRHLITRRIADHDDIQRIKELRVREREAMQTDYDKVCSALKKFEEV